jgi:alanyl-tRNA synthetase
MVFHELEKQKDFVARVIQEEENSFLRTLSNGLERINEYLQKNSSSIDGKTAFELYDTFGFPIDLTQLIASENGAHVDIVGFEVFLQEQKARSRKDAVKETGDWQYITEDENEEFIGYDFLEATVNIARYRVLKIKDKQQFQLVFNITPFYAESGGQVGDTGFMKGLVNGEVIEITDTQKENDLIIHYVDKLPQDSAQAFEVKVDETKRRLTENNHSATHLLHAALKQVLGNHVAQKGSLVNSGHLRFDFSHFAKMSEEELLKVEHIVNEKIAENIALEEKRNVPIKQATEELGATALFGEKYGELVRVITFDKNFSVELCGGTHVKNTGLIRRFKITSESSVAAGVRRVEAVTNIKADEYYSLMEQKLKNISQLLGDPKDIEATIQKLNAERSELQKRLETLELEKAAELKKALESKMQKHDGMNTLFERADGLSAEHLKTICFQFRNEQAPIFGVIASMINDKPMLTVFASDDLVKDKGINCSNIVRELARNIDGGGGGQPFFATAGGKKAEGLDAALQQAKGVMK